MSFLIGKAAQPIITPERTDKNWYQVPLSFGAITVTAAMFGIPMLLTGSTTTAPATIYLTIFTASYAVATWCFRYFLSAGRIYWSHDSRQVVTTTPTGTFLFEAGVPLLGVLGVLLIAAAWLLHRQGGWIGSTALAALRTLSLPCPLQALQGFRPVRRHIMASKSGIELIQTNGHSHEIPWKEHSRLIGVRQADAVIALESHLETRHPIGYLPLSIR